MNSKRIISLILSILMTIQVFAFQTPVNAMEGVNPTIQKSEGQKIGKRSEVFEFKNNEKPKLSWFTTRSRSPFGARDVDLTKSEKVKIETTATGLDEGTFNWEAFGQNKKFNAWIEVAYVDDVNKEGEPIRHKVSENFEINKAGTIETNITVDASKRVDNYYIVTEYDDEPDSFNINAFFDRTTIKSDKGEKSIAFKLDVHQIVSTKITYNLIDEYGKAIDLTDTKEAKPADTDLANLGKIGDVTTFNLKNEGTENLWQTEMQKDEPNFDESDLTSSTLKMTLTKNEIKSNNIDYKLTSTYDVINGGKVTIQRQKDVVTPKDPKNPGVIPAGYARLSLSADATGAGPTGTFNKDNATDNRRVVDVKAGKAYTTAQAEVEKQGKPFPLTGENKVDTGKTFDKWTPALDTLGTAVAKDTKNLNATYKSSDKEIIPYLPTEPAPTDDGNGLPIPTDYVTVTFKSEDAKKGNVKIGNKEGATVLAKVKPGIDLSQKAEITTVPVEHYGFTQWKPVLGKAAEGQTYTAYFVKSGEEIGEKDPIPEGWFKVTVSQDDDSIVANTVKKAVYPVEPNGKLASDKFADLTNKAKDGYKDPAWYVGSDKVEKPYEVVINSSIDFIARAIELESHKITKDNGLKPVDFTAYKGDEMGKDFWKKGVALTTPDENLQKILDAATVTDESNRSTDKAGTHEGTLKVIFKDGSTIEVQNQKLIVIDTTVSIDYDKDAKAPRHNDEVVKGKIKTSEMVEGAKVEILDSENNVIGITLAKADGSFIAGTRKLQAGETIKVRVTLPKAGKASEPVEKTVKLNADRLNELLPIAKEQYKNFKDKENAFIKDKLDKLNTAITTADPLVDSNGKATATDTAENQTAIDNAFKALEEALKALTANIPPTISGPKTHEIFVGEDLDLKKLVDVTDGDGAGDLVVENGSNVKITAVKVEGQNQTPVTNLSNIKDNVGTYKVTYTAKDNAGAKVTHEMTLTVKPRTTSAIEVTKDPNKMSYLITEKDGKAKLDLTGMTLNLVDNLGKKTKVELTDPKVKFKVNGKEIKDGGDLKLEDDVKFIEVEYTPEGSQTPFKAQTKGVLRVGPDYDNDGTDDRTQNFDPEKIEKLEVIKQPQLDYIAKDKSEADKVFNLNLEGMIVRMTDKAGKEKLAVVSNGKFVDYDDTTKEITQLTATPAHGTTLTPQTSDTDKGHNGSKVTITGPNNSKAETEPLKVFYDANKDGNPDYGQEQKTPAPSAMARNVGKDPKVTTVEGMATPGAVIKIYKEDDTNLANPLTTEPTEIKADASGHYTATLSPMLADKTDIKVTAKLGEMGESDPTEAKVFDDKNNNKQPDRDEGFNIAKATDIKFVDQPDLTYLVKTKETEVTFNGKDAKGKAIYLELSYKNGDKTESKIMTLEDLMKDTENIAVTPAKSTKDKIENQTHDLVGKAIEVKLVKADKTATSTSKFAIEIDADGNGKADKDEKTPAPTAKALNQGADPKVTTITGKAEKGAKVVAMVGNVKVGETTANDNGDYTIEAKQNGAALPVDTRVNVTAQVGVKKVSDPTEAIVKADKDGNGVADNEENFDITKTAKIEMVSDPNKMDYLVTTQDGKVKFDAKGMLVRLTDKAGKEKLYTAEELAKDTTNFTVAPANGADLTIEANHGKKVKVTLKNAPADMTTNEVETSRALSVKLDANNNGKPDDQEVFDITKATKVEIIKNPDKMDYLVSKKDGKASFETKGLLIRLTDASGKTATYTAEDLEKNGIKDKFTLSPAKDDKLGLTSEGKTNSMDFTVTVAGAEATKKPTIKADRQVIVKLDADGNGTADVDETTATPTVTARNIGENPTKTTVEGTAPKGSTVTIKYTLEGGEETTKTVTANEQGKYSADITPKLEAGKEVKVTAKDGEKKVSPEVKTQVFDDKDNDGKDDKSQNFDITKADKIEVVYDPAKMNYLVTSEDGKVALETKGMVVKVTDKAGVEKKFTAEEIAKDTKNFTVEPKEGTEIGLDNNGKPIKVTLNVKGATTKEATTSNLSVKLDANGNGIDDEKEKLDLAKVTGIKIIKQPQLNYPITTEGGKKNINLSDMVVELTDGVNKANYTAQELLAAKIGEGQAAKAAFKLELVKGSATAAPTTKDITSLNGIELTTANDGNKVEIALAAKTDVKTETEALQVFEDLDGDGKRDSKQTPAPKDLKALNKGNDTFTTITGKATKGGTLKVYGEDKKEIPVDQSNITIDENGNFTIKVSKDNKALDPNTTVFVTAQAKDKEESARIPVVVQVDKDGNGTADKDERTTIKSVIARNIGTGEPKVSATFTTIEGVAEPGSTVTIKLTPKAEEGQTATEVTKIVKADAQTGEYKLELKAGENELTNNILLPADTVVKAQAKFGDKKDSPTIETKVFEDLNADGKDDNATNQKTDRPTAKALNVGTEPKITTITGKAEPNAKIVAKATIENKEVVVGTITANNKGDYKIEATKTGQANGGALDKDTPVQVTAQVTGKLVSDPETAIVKMDKDGNGVADDEEQFNIKKATDVKILQNPSKMKYSVKTKDGKANFDANGLLIEVSDGSGKSKTYNYAEITSDANKNNFTLSPADKAEIRLGENGAAKEIPFKVTVTGSDTQPTVTADEKVKVILDADGNGKHDKDETTTITSVIARNIGTGNTSPKTKATFTTIEGVAEPGSTVTIKFTPKAEEGQTATEVTKTAKADDQTGAYKLELKGATEAENILLPADTEVKASAKFGDKKTSGEITTKVFEDLDADGKADNPNANKTERPSALAYNFKDEAKTTIKGDAEPGAKVIAKVGETKVGEATANSDGKYEISATKDNAKLPKGTKVSVTATLAPKGESPAQETVVYEDLDGDGQPDTSQVFDKDKIRGLEVVASPNKMVYNNKEKLDLSGMKVLLTDQMGNMKIVDFSEFETYGITVKPLNNIELSDKNVADGGHNGQKIKAEVKVTIGNNQETYSGETPTALEVNKDQSAQPTDVEAANQGTKTTTTVRGKATPGAKVEVKNANGQVIGTVDQVPANGEFQVEVTKQADKAKVKVTATESGKTESAPQEAKVFRDKDSDWKDDKGGKVEIEKPVVDPIKVGDESVKVKTPGEGITKITVKDEKGKTIDVVKDGNDWKVDGKPVEKDGTKLVIPTKDKGLDFGAYEKVEITNHDDEGNEGKIVVATKPANLKPMEKPTIDPISTQSTKITGKSLPGSKVLVYLPGDTDETVKEALVKSDGSYELTLATPLADKSLVKVKATNPQREGTGEAETKVGLNTKQLEDTKTEADGLINDSKTNNNFDPDNNKYDKNLEDKTKAAQEILERAKDNKDDNDPTQTQVNTAEKELRDAINQKNADDKVKVVEKAVKDGQKPIEDQINQAQEAIDKVTDPTAKKELQDRLDKAKALDELKDAKDDLDKVIDKAVEEKKPIDEIDKAKKESKKADEIINSGGNGKTVEDLVKEVESIKEMTKKLGQPAIRITIDSAINNSSDLILTTNPGRCKVNITIYYADGGEKEYVFNTDPNGVGSILLEKPLQIDDYIEVKATRKLKPTDKPDYLDNSTSTYVY